MLGSKPAGEATVDQDWHDWQDWKVGVLLVVVIAAMVLLGLNIFRAGDNRARLAEVTQRQAFINETVRISNFSSQFIQSVATVAANTGDQNIRDVLARHGVTFEVQAPAAAPADAGADAGAAQGEGTTP
jgi:hypothetical protein